MHTWHLLLAAVVAEIAAWINYYTSVTWAHRAGYVMDSRA